MDVTLSKIPVAMDFYSGTHHWRHYNMRKIRRIRTGWLRVIRVSFQFPFANYEKDLLICCDDHENPISPDVAATLFEMSSSIPYYCQDYEPLEQLDEIQDAWVWDFIGGCDIQSLEYLEEAEREMEQTLKDTQERVQRVVRKLENEIRCLQRTARKLGTSIDDLHRIDQRIRRQERFLDIIPVALRREQNSIREEIEDLEEQVFRSLKSMPNIDHLYTIHWRVI